MKKLIKSAAFISLLCVVGACKKEETVTVTLPSATPADLQQTPAAPTKTLETKKLGAAVDEYVGLPNDVNAAEVKQAFADLDGEIAELQSRVAQTTGNDQAEARAKLENLQTYRAAEFARFSVASVKLPAPGATPTCAGEAAGSRADGR